MKKKINEKVNLLIITHGDGIKNVLDRMLPKLKGREKINITICHQIKSNFDVSKNIEGPVNYNFSYSGGISKNRNHCLSLLEDEINLLADDDLEYLNGFEHKVLDAFNDNPEADIITFEIENRRRFFKKFWHNKFSILRVASVSIAFRKSAIKKNKLKFNEKFGVNATYISGEENLFLKDALDAGLKILALPEVIVKHPGRWTSDVFTKKQIESKVAIFRELYGNFYAFLSIFYFAFLKRKVHKVSILKYLRIGLKFWWKIL